MLAITVVALALQSPGDSVTLTEALQAARVGPRARTIAATVAAAVADQRVAGIIPNPTAALSRVDQIDSRRLTVSQPLSWLPRRGSDLSAASSMVAGSRFDSMQVAADLVRDVRIAFFDALASTQGARLAQEQALIADSLAVLAAKRAAAGDISDFERDQIGQEAAKARILASEARATARTGRARLGELMAWTGDDLPRPAGALDEGLSDAQPGLPVAVNDLPSVRAANAIALAAHASVRSAEWGRIPVPGLFLEQDWNSLATNTTRLGVSLPVPLFNQGNEQVAVARARAARLDAAAEAARINARERVTVARANLDDARERARVARDTLTANARRLREGTVRLYEAGRASVLDVLEALRAERDANALLVRAMRDFQQTRAELDAAMGIVR